MPSSSTAWWGWRASWRCSPTACRGWPSWSARARSPGRSRPWNGSAGGSATRPWNSGWCRSRSCSSGSRALVRDLAEKTGKRIDFRMEGEETLLDRTIVERLAEPMIHLIRNAVDHGLETPEERSARGSRRPAGSRSGPGTRGTAWRSASSTTAAGSIGRRSSARGSRSGSCPPTRPRRTRASAT